MFYYFFPHSINWIHFFFLRQEEEKKTKKNGKTSPSGSCNPHDTFKQMNHDSKTKKKKEKKGVNLPLGILWRNNAKYWRLCRRSALSSGCWVGRPGTVSWAGGDGLDAPGMIINSSCSISRLRLTAAILAVACCCGGGGVGAIRDLPTVDLMAGWSASSDGGRDGGRPRLEGSGWAGGGCGGGDAAALELVVVKLTPSSSSSSSSSIDNADDFASPPLRLSSSIPAGNSSSPDQDNNNNRKKKE